MTSPHSHDSPGQRAEEGAAGEGEEEGDRRGRAQGRQGKGGATRREALRKRIGASHRARPPQISRKVRVSYRSQLSPDERPTRSDCLGNQPSLDSNSKKWAVI